MKKIWNDRAIRADSNTTREDIEAMDIERERERDALADYVIVEKVIGVREQEGGTEYLVKCMYPHFQYLFMAYNTTRETSYL